MPEITAESLHVNWINNFDERQQKLIQNCCNYADSSPAGLPGHNLMIIISIMTDLLNKQGLKNDRTG